MPPLAIAGVASAVVGGVGSVIAADRAGDAIENAGEAQIKAAREGVAAANEAIGRSERERLRVEDKGIALGNDVGGPSVMELAAVSRILDTKQQFLTRAFTALEKEEAVLSEIDPVIKESGKQTLELLRGKQSAYLEPMMAQRERDKRNLETQLARRFGPGFRTTSAGIEALSKFDDGTSMLAMQGQQKALSDVSTIFQNAMGLRPKNLATNVAQVFGTAAGMDESAARIATGQADRRANAVMSGFRQTPVDYGMITTPFSSLAGVAGKPAEGNLARAQGVGQIFGEIGRTGGQVVGTQMDKLFPSSGGGVQGFGPTAPGSSSGWGALSKVP